MPALRSAVRKVALVGYPGVQSLDLIGPWEVFAMANRFAGERHYQPILAAPEAGEILSNSGLKLGGAVAVADLADDGRYPQFGPAAMSDPSGAGQGRGDRGDRRR